MSQAKLQRTDAERELARLQALVAKGVDFGVIVYRSGIPDTAGVVGVDPALVSRGAAAAARGCERELSR